MDEQPPHDGSLPTDALRLAALTPANVVAANTLTLRPGQDAFVAPVAYSIAEAYVNQGTMWPRVVEIGDAVAGFILANFDETTDDPLYRSSILRINVDAEFQRRGVGSFTFDAIVAEAHRRGFDRVCAVWEEGELGPGPFFEAVGFRRIDETDYGEIVAERRIP